MDRGLLSSAWAQFRGAFPCARGMYLRSHVREAVPDAGGRRAGPSHSTSARTEPEHGDLSRKSRQCLEAVRGTFLYSSITSSFNFSHLFGKMIAKTLYPTISTSLECQAAPSGPSSHCKNRPSRLRGFSQRRADDCSRQNNRMLTSSLDGSNQ